MHLVKIILVELLEKCARIESNLKSTLNCINGAILSLIH